MIDASMINQDCCTMCQNEPPIGVSMQIQAVDCKGAYGLKYVYFCENCFHLYRQFEIDWNKFSELKLKEFTEKFIEEHANIKGKV